MLYFIEKFTQGRKIMAKLIKSKGLYATPYHDLTYRDKVGYNLTKKHQEKLAKKAKIEVEKTR